MSIALPICGPCYRERGERQRLERRVSAVNEDGTPAAWEWRCPSCGYLAGVMLNGGTLDLGIVRESITQEHNDFEVFPEGPWRT